LRKALGLIKPEAAVPPVAADAAGKIAAPAAPAAAGLKPAPARR
jgi:hypothetical protein